MRQYKSIGLMMLAAGMLAATSCSDFDDYNNVPVEEGGNGAALAGQTLWQTISQDAQLSDFKALVERTGFNENLSQPRAYTVWAPKNGTFSMADYDSMSDSMLLEQFVKNHIAEYTYRASGDIGNNRIHMLNGKSYVFAGNGNYTFGSADVDPEACNLPGSNGILHKLNEKVDFFANLYEYLRLGTDIDSLRNYFLRYEESRLDLEQSEKGPIVDGKQTYVDSVIVTTNTLTRWLDASIANEDSSYTFIMPTDKAYLDLYNKVKECYKYRTGILVQDVAALASEGTTNASGDNTRNGFKRTGPTLNATYWQDSLSRRQVVRNLVFSNNDPYNQFVLERDATEGDTLRSTGRVFLTNPDELLRQHLVGEPVEMSNGYARLVDSVALLPWETYCPELAFTPTRHLLRAFNGKSTFVSVLSPWMAEQLVGPGQEEFRYRLIEASGARTKPGVFISLPEVQSTTYRFYCVVLPWTVGAQNGDYGDSIARPTPMNFDLSYCNASGALANYHFSADKETGRVASTANPPTLNLDTSFKNDPTKIDTLYLGEFTFPLSYRGLGEDYAPSIHISSPISVFNSGQMAQYSREFRIYAIILEPVEKARYEEEKNN